MNKILFFIVLAILVLEPTGYSRVQLKSINTGDTFVRLPKTAKKVARVRLGLQIVPYKKLVVTGKDGVNRIGFAKNRAIKRNLRSRIEKTTHFYVDRWHVELEPSSWDKTSKKLKYRIRLYKQYGNSRELEEQIGSIDVEGILVGSRFVYSFEGQGSVKFKNKSGQPIGELYVQRPFNSGRKLNVAKYKNDSQDKTE